MKTTILTVAILVFATLTINAQQNSTAKPAKAATRVMKVDSKESTITAPVGNAAETKACCAGKTQAQCSHDSKACTKGEESKAACCQKGSAQGCSHGAPEKSTEQKSQ